MAGENRRDPFDFTERCTNGFTPIFPEIAQELGHAPALVFGMVWAHCHSNDDRICYCPKTEMAKILCISAATFSKHLARVIAAGYLEDLAPNTRGKPHTYKDTGKFKYQR